ncbi:MAG: hypothetical protein H3Z54_06840 [archaeon]|nr:hypothetical protein [archaeon]
MALNSFSNKRLVTDGRLFNIHTIRAKNGCFLIVSEGEEMKLGSIALSVKIGDKANSSIIIPSKFGDIYSRIISESVSIIINGIVLASLYSITPIDAQIARRLLEEIRDLFKT